MTTPIKRRQSLHLQMQENAAHISALEEQVVSAQKLASLGTMACLVAHEFNNILVPMINYAELALKHEDDTQLMRKALEKTIKHGNRAATIIQSMLGMVRDQTQTPQEVKIIDLINDCFQLMARDLKKDRILVKINVPDELTIFTHPNQLQQVLLNLIINARQAMLDAGGILTVSAEKSDKTIQITVSDSGKGIEKSQIDKIFEPFYTTKTQADSPDKQGTGLGLTVCRNIIESLGGAISVKSNPKEGTIFWIDLPIAHVE
ncbi:MAG: sensor histidine kinase [Planctomycetes bacterium]|nr:sensor histidine kinase [Planctomycetota bacterium]